MRGEVYKVGVRRLSHQINAATEDAARVEFATARRYLENSDQDWSYAAWAFLWLRRDAVIFSVRLWGLTFWRFRWNQLRDAWALAFGTCPFPWETGPDALTF